MRTQTGDAAHTCDVFVSYASADRVAVAELVEALRLAGLSAWWDRDRIDTFDGITTRLEQGIAGAKLVLACLSQTYPSRPACQWEALQVVRRIPPGQLHQRLLAVSLDDRAGRVVWPVLSDLRLGSAGADGDWSAVAFEIRGRLDRLPVDLDGTVARIGETPKTTVTWLPSPRGTSATFTGRFAEMLNLHSRLVSDKTGLDTGRVGTRMPVGVVGPGGVGKTLLVSEYVNHFSGYWPTVIQLDALGDTFDHRIVDHNRAEWLTALAEQVSNLTAAWHTAPASDSAIIDIDAREAEGQEFSLARARLDARRIGLATALRDAGPVLWWADDVPDGVAEDWSRLLPPSQLQASTVITSRSDRYSSVTAELELDTFPVDPFDSGSSTSTSIAMSGAGAGVELLAAHRPGRDERGTRRPIPSDERDAMIEVNALLGGLPLALDVTGARVARTRMPWTQAVVMLRVDPLKADAVDLDPVTGHARSVQATFASSLTVLAGESELGAEAVAACVLLGAGRRIPRALIADILASDQWEVDGALEPALGLRLLTLDDDTIRIHELIAVVARAEALLDSAAGRAVTNRLAQLAQDPAWLVEALARYGPGQVQRVLDASDAGGLTSRMVRSHTHVLGEHVRDRSAIATTLTWAALRIGRDTLANAFRDIARTSSDSLVLLPTWTSDRSHPALVRTLAGRAGVVESVAFGVVEGRTLLAAGTTDSKVQVWDPANGQLLHTLASTQGRVESVAFGATDGRTLLAAGNSESTAQVWDPASGELVHTLTGHERDVMSVAFGVVEGSALLATGSLDSTVRIWNPASGELVRTLTGLSAGVDSVAFGVVKEHTVVAAGCVDGTVGIWDPASGQLMHNLTGHDAGVSSLAFGVVDGRSLLATGSWDCTVRVWDPMNGQLLRSMTDHHSKVLSVAFGVVNDRKLLATGGAGSALRIWDPATGQLVQAFAGHDSIVNSVAFGVVSGRTLLAAGSWDGKVQIWDPVNGQLLPTPTGHEGDVLSVALGIVDGHSLLASGSLDHTARVWDPTNGQIVHTLNGHEREVSSVAFGDVDGHTLLATGSMDTTVRMWDLATGQVVHTLTGHEREVLSMAFGVLDGRTLLATGSMDTTVRVWDPSTGQVVQTLTGHDGRVEAVEFGVVDGRTMLATGSSDSTVRVWDPSSGQLLHTLAGLDDVLSVAFGEVDGRTLLATGGMDSTVRIWDPSTGQLLNTLTDHNGGVWSVIFGMIHGRALLATGGNDSTVRIWDPSTGQLLDTFTDHTAAVTSVVFAVVDGHDVLATGSRNHVQVLEISETVLLSRL